MHYAYLANIKEENTDIQLHGGDGSRQAGVPIRCGSRSVDPDVLSGSEAVFREKKVVSGFQRKGWIRIKP